MIHIEQSSFSRNLLKNANQSSSGIANGDNSIAENAPFLENGDTDANTEDKIIFSIPEDR